VTINNGKKSEGCAAGVVVLILAILVIWVLGTLVINYIKSTNDYESGGGHFDNGACMVKITPSPSFSPSPQ